MRVTSVESSVSEQGRCWRVRKQTRLRQADLYEAVCAVLYLLKSGCPWRRLPSDIPKWRTVHHYCSLWRATPDTGGEPARAGLILDAQSVKHTDSARHKGYDAGRKVSGIKRHLVVDTQGLSHARVVTAADVTDRQGALEAIDRCQKGLSGVRSVRVEAAIPGSLSRRLSLTRWGPRSQVVKRSELHRFAVIPPRRGVERFCAWREKCRRLWKNCERLLNTGLQFVNLACLALLSRK